jgi:uncharacterized protein (TIGR02246 family)
MTRNLTPCLLCGVVCAILSAAGALAQAPPATQPGEAGIDHLREALKAAYNQGDIEAILKYLHPDAVIIFPDGQILKGREGLRDYYQHMLKGPDHIVVSYTAEPVVQSRTVHNDVALSYGLMNDQYVLTNGKTFGLNSRFTATLYRSPDGPPESDGWMIRSFHSSTDAFDNPVLALATRRAFWISGIGGLVIGALLGLVSSRLLPRRRSRPSSAASA